MKFNVRLLKTGTQDYIQMGWRLYLHNQTRDEWFSLGCDCFCDVGGTIKKVVGLYGWSLDDRIRMVSDEDVAIPETMFH